MYKKIVLILLLFTIITSSCRSKKEATCPSFDIEKTENENIEKKGSKYSIIILKDGKRINNSKRKRKRKSENKLFKKKMY